MPDHLDHLQWTRLEVEPAYRPRQGFGSQPTLRSDPRGHGGRLLGEAQGAVGSSRAVRQAGGIDPARLLVLRMRFLDLAQRELLTRLGIDVVDEREERLTLDSPYYELSIEFTNPGIRNGFRQYPGVGRLRRRRSPRAWRRRRRAKADPAVPRPGAGADLPAGGPCRLPDPLDGAGQGAEGLDRHF